MAAGRAGRMPGPRPPPRSSRCPADPAAHAPAPRGRTKRRRQQRPQPGRARSLLKTSIDPGLTIQPYIILSPRDLCKNLTLKTQKGKRKFQEKVWKW
ncbi:protein phosphatase 1 regulatory subunit 26 isoform X2 [Alligator mississippiensis]|uniref:protein phosphatase 1 regulatory subunit 26 isoform X2 n=1 Tax=Alligator mississippiensis TaxID=8496 RepID=UPI002877EF74|nr:protein phosphatase 1 regulatory subunit 26 isoform X2 [Alligator mississippiensis]